jgi:hypothetical protein
MTLYLTPPAAPEAPFGIHKNGYIRVLRVAADTRLFEASSAYISERITILF